MKEINIHVIVLAGGTGKRFGHDHPKQFVFLNGKPLLYWSIETFTDISNLASIIIVGHGSWEKQTQKVLSSFASDKILTGFVTGGKERQDSSRNGVTYLKKFAQPDDIVLIHDAARPNVTMSLIQRVIDGAITLGAAVPVVPHTDSIIEIENGIVFQYLDRSRFQRVQTPQGFRFSIISDAHKKALEAGIYNSTDDGNLVIQAGYPVGCVEGYPDNIKVTTKLDLQYLSSVI